MDESLFLQFEGRNSDGQKGVKAYKYTIVTGYKMMFYATRSV
jgi:hypothetical protein